MACNLCYSASTRGGQVERTRLYQVSAEHLGIFALAWVVHAGLRCAGCVVVVQLGAILLPEIDPALLVGALIAPAAVQPDMSFKSAKALQSLVPKMISRGLLAYCTRAG